MRGSLPIPPRKAVFLRIAVWVVYRAGSNEYATGRFWIRGSRCLSQAKVFLKEHEAHEQAAVFQSGFHVYRTTAYINHLGELRRDTVQVPPTILKGLRRRFGIEQSLRTLGKLL